MIGSGGTVPVAQLLSQNHDANYIEFWLTSWFADLKKPDEVIIDGSEALIRASVRSFTQYANTNEYITACMKALIEKGAPPRCFIRLDRSHFVRSIHKNKVLRKLDQRVNRLVKGVIGYLIKCESMKAVKDILIKLFTLTRNTMGTEEVSNAKSYLVKLVQTHVPFDEIRDEENTKCTEVIKSEKITYRDTLVFKWVKAIHDAVAVEQTAECDPSTLPNIYYSDALNEYLLELFVRIPMWSNVMCGICESCNLNPSSSASESEFKNIKKLSGIKTKLVNVFVDLHCKNLSGNMKIRLGEQRNRTLRDTPQKSETLLDDDVRLIKLKRSSSLTKIFEGHPRNHSLSLSRSRSENDIFEQTIENAADIHTSSDNDSSIENRRKEIPEENWKNKNTEPPVLRRSKASILNPHDVNYKYNSVPLLKNAYTSPRKVNNKYVDLRHTCAYDSTYCIYTAAFLDDERLHQIIDSCEANQRFSYFIKKILERRQDSKQFYIDKTEILYQLYSKFYKKQIKETKNSISMNCETAFGPFMKKLFSEIDSDLLSSVTEIRSCPKCQNDIEEKSPFGKVRFVDKISLQRLSSYLILEEDKNWRCRACNTRMETTLEYANLIAFDVEPAKERLIFLSKIDDVQEALHINEAVYNLFAVVEFKAEIRHFLAHVKRANGVWETYDDLKMDVIRSRKCTTTPMAIFAVFYNKQ